MASPEDATDLPDEVPDPLNADPAVALERELYWAARPGAHDSQALASSTPGSELAIVWSEMEDRLRHDYMQVFPPDEEVVEIGGGLKRGIKRVIFRTIRPLVRRYDRLLADVARLGADTARSVAGTQRELARLREQVRSMTPGSGTAEPATSPAEHQGTPVFPEALARRLSAAMRGDGGIEAARLDAYEVLAGSLRERAGGSAVWLEVGCEEDELAVRLLASGWRVVASDPSADAVAASRERGVDAHVAGAPAFLDGYDGEAPGVVHLVRVFEHLAPSAWLEVLRRSADVLASGGALLVEAFDPRSPSSLPRFFTDVTHRWPAHPEVLRVFVEHVGLRDVEVRGLGPAEGSEHPAYLLVARKP